MEVKNFEDEIDAILGDDLSVDEIIKEAVGGSKKVKEETVKVVDYLKYEKSECVVIDIKDFKEALRIAKSISPLNELANFLSFKVEDSKLFLYVTNVNEYIKTIIPIKNINNRMKNGEFFTLPIDTLIKAFRSSREAITIFKEEGKFRVTVFGGSIPVESNAGVTEEVYLKGLTIADEAENAELGIDEYKEIVSSMAGLANSAVALQQKTIVLEGGHAKNSFIRCYNRKKISSNVNLVMRIMDISIINILTSNEKGFINILRDGNKLVYKIGEHQYSCLEAKSYISKTFEESTEKVNNENSSVYEISLSDLRMITNLLVSLKNVKEYVYLSGNVDGIVLETLIENEENVFKVDGRKINNLKLDNKIKLETAILNSIIANYGDVSNIIINEEFLVVDSADKTSYLGVEII